MFGPKVGSLKISVSVEKCLFLIFFPDKQSAYTSSGKTALIGLFNAKFKAFDILWYQKNADGIKNETTKIKLTLFCCGDTLFAEKDKNPKVNFSQYN